MKRDLILKIIGENIIIVVNDDDSYVFFERLPNVYKDLFGTMVSYESLLNEKFLFANDLANHITAYNYKNYKVEKFNDLMIEHNLDFKKIRKIIIFEYNGEYDNFGEIISRAKVKIYYPHSRIMCFKEGKIIDSKKLNDFDKLLKKALKVEMEI